MPTPPALDDFEWSEADYWLLRSLPECMKAPRTSCHSPAGNEIDFDNRARLHAQTIGDGNAKRQTGER